MREAAKRWAVWGWRIIGVGCLGLWSFWSSLAGLPEGFRFAWPLPQGNTLQAVWAAGVDDVFVGGEGGTLMRWDGTQWHLYSIPTQKSILAIHGTGPNDVWAVGGDSYAPDPMDRALILHFDGEQWREASSPQWIGESRPLTSVYAISPTDVWATLHGAETVLHYDGKVWKEILVPLPIEGELTAVAATRPDHVFFVGTHGQIVHKDGSTWRLEQKLEEGGFTMHIFQSVWASDLEHVYAGDNNGRLYHRQPDGTWVSYPTTSGSWAEDNSSLGIWVDPNGAVYIVGTGSVRRFQDGKAVKLQLHHQPFTWWERACGIDGHLYAVGYLGTIHEIIPKDEEAWVSPLSIDGSEEIRCEPAGAVALGPDTVLVYAYRSLLVDAWPLYIVSPEGAFRFPVLPEGMPAQGVRILAATANGPNDILLAWTEIVTFQGYGVSHWNGERWKPITALRGDDVLAFWRSPSEKIYACLSKEIYRTTDLQHWDRIYFDPFETLIAFYGVSDTELYAATQKGEILRYDGSKWKRESLPNPEKVIALNGDGTDLYAIGENGGIWWRGPDGWVRIKGIDQRPDNDFTSLATTPYGVLAVQRIPEFVAGSARTRIWRIQQDHAELWAVVSYPIQAIVTTSAGKTFWIGVESMGRRTCLITDAPLPEGFSLGRLEPDPQGWAALGNSGVWAQVPDSVHSRPLLAVWSHKGTLPTLDLAVDSVDPSAEAWSCLIKQAYDRLETSWLPTMKLQIRQPLPGREKRLFSYDGRRWEEFTLEGTLIPEFFNTKKPVPLLPFTIVSFKPGFSPRLSIARMADGQIRISWDVSAQGFILEWTSDLIHGPWQEWTESDPVQEGDLWIITVPLSGKARYFRLRKP